MNVTNESYLLKMKLANMPDKTIAAKLGMTEEQVREAWEQLQQRGQAFVENGYGDFGSTFGILCHQYQLLGESMKTIAQAISNIMPAEEIRRLLPNATQEEIDKLVRSAIILRPFKKPSQEPSEGGNPSGN